MIQKANFKTKQGLEERLMSYDKIYAIDSIETSSVKYGISDGKFAVLWQEGFVMCPMREVPAMADIIGTKYAYIKDEILAVYEDVKGIDLREWRTHESFY